MQDSDVIPPQAPVAKGTLPPPPVPAPPAPALPGGAAPLAPPPAPERESAERLSGSSAGSLPPVVPPGPATATAHTSRHKAAPQKGERTPLAPGAKVGQYTITAEIGIGGFGIVYSATHTQDGTPVAIKEHMPEGLAVRRANDTYVHPSSPETEERFKATVGEFLEEVTVLMGISHPGIVPILTAFEANGTAYYVMPLQKGTPMEVADQGSLDVAEQSQVARHNKRLLLSMLSTLDYLRLHQIVHRDIKPDNILITEEGNTVLLDFGSARQVQPGKVFTNVFTPDFAAPEQSHAETDAEMSESLGPWTDLYSLGVCFYYLITHLFPPRSELRVISAQDPYTPLAGRADLEHLYGAPFLKAIDRALELKISDRWQSAAAWRIAIGEGMMPTPPKKKRTLRRSTMVTLVAGSIFGAMGIWAFYERGLALKALDTSLTFNNILLNDISRESADIPGAAGLQRVLSQRLEAYLSSIEHTPGIDEVKYLRTLSSAWSKYGELLVAQGRLKEADTAYHRAAELLRELQPLEPGSVIPTYELATVLLGRAEIARNCDRDPHAHQYLREATRLIQTLCDKAPHNPDFISTLGQTMQESAQLARRVGHKKEYREKLTRTLDLYRDMQNNYPEHIKGQEGLGYALLYSGLEAIEQEKPEEAREQLEEARRIFANLTALRPYQLSFKNGLARTYNALGNLFCHLSDTTAGDDHSNQYKDQALNAYRKHNELISYLETQDGDKEENAYRLCRTLSRMVNILLSSDQPNLAESYCKTILIKTDKLLEDDPDNMEYSQLAAGAKRGIAIAHSRSPYYAKDATEDFRLYRSAMEELAKRSPEAPALQLRYAESLKESAEYAQNTGAPTEQAREWLTLAESVLRKLTEQHPEEAEYSSALQEVSTLIQNLPKPPPTTNFTAEE